MLNTHTHAATRALALAAALTLATAATACGDDDNDSAGQPGKASQAQSEPAANNASAAGGDPKRQIEQVLNSVQADYVDGDAASYCSKLTPAGQAQVADFGAQFNQGTSCPEVIRSSSRLSRQVGIKQKPTKLLSVRINGDKAIAKISNGGRRPEPMRFVRLDGEWKIPNPGYKYDESETTDPDENPLLKSGRKWQAKQARKK